MKPIGDSTRSTFKRENNYNGVRMQQGRVQLDADWNEQVDINSYRIETETQDVIGLCGAPLAGGGFKIDPTMPDKGNLNISKGSIYVHGILCENLEDVNITDQLDLPGFQLPTDSGTYLAYLEVWQRHITAIEDPDIREVALGGPDTATRSKTVWQVKLLPVGNETVNCLSDFPDWNNLIAGSGGKLRAFTKQDTTSTDPCKVSPRAGYQRLENQLYRVEIHKEGDLEDDFNSNKATFKWSRDNGSVVFAIEEFVAGEPNKIKVSNLGRDNTLGLQAGDWVEVLDDATELSGMPGTMAKIIGPPDAAERIITLNKPISGYDMAGHPKMRRWDQKSDEITVTSNPVQLEDGVFVQFSGNKFKTGDYWLIPARTATGDVKWLHDSANKPIPQPPQGIERYYCRLALLQFEEGEWACLNDCDCRRLFPPVTELTSLFYISGDGQEAVPDLTNPADPVPLLQPLKVGVANGRWPVAGAKVRFLIVQGSGQLQTTGETYDDGIASCYWELDSTTQSQQVEATLLDAANNPIHLPIIFSANLSVASQVAYDPKKCTHWGDAQIKTVQGAIDELCRMCREKEPAIHITNVYLLDEESTPLKNDIRVSVEALAKGIHVDYEVEDRNKNSIIDKINPATCFVTLDIPFLYCDLAGSKKRTKVKEKDKIKAVVGYQPLILEANLFVKEEFIEWKLDENLQYCLLQQFNGQNTNWSDALRNWPDSKKTRKGILAHLMLKGNFTWDININTIRNSRSGNDFEMWFWLVEEAPHLNLEEIQQTETPYFKSED